MSVYLLKKITWRAQTAVKANQVRIILPMHSAPESLKSPLKRVLLIQGRIMVPRDPEAWKRLRAPRAYICNVDLILVLFLLLPSLLEMSFSRGVNCGRMAGRMRCRLANILKDRKFSLYKFWGPKWYTLKFSMYREVQAHIGARAWGFNLTSLMDDPALYLSFKFTCVNFIAWKYFSVSGDLSCG